MSTPKRLKVDGRLYVLASEDESVTEPAVEEDEDEERREFLHKHYDEQDEARHRKNLGKQRGFIPSTNPSKEGAASLPEVVKYKGFPYQRVASFDVAASPLYLSYYLPGPAIHDVPPENAITGHVILSPQMIDRDDFVDCFEDELGKTGSRDSLLGGMEAPIRTLAEDLEELISMSRPVQIMLPEALDPSSELYQYLAAEFAGGEPVVYVPLPAWNAAAQLKIGNPA